MLPTHGPSAIGAEWPAQTPSYLLQLTATSRPSLAGIVALLTAVLVAPFTPEFRTSVACTGLGTSLNSMRLYSRDVSVLVGSMVAIKVSRCSRLRQSLDAFTFSPTRD